MLANDPCSSERRQETVDRSIVSQEVAQHIRTIRTVLAPISVGVVDPRPRRVNNRVRSCFLHCRPFINQPTDAFDIETKVVDNDKTQGSIMPSRNHDKSFRCFHGRDIQCIFIQPCQSSRTVRMVSALHGIAVAVAGWMVIGKTMVTKRLTLFMSIPFYDEALVSEGFSSQGDTWQVRVKIK